MTDGMKSGAGTDPFADEPNDEDDSEPAEVDDQELEESTKARTEQESVNDTTESPDTSIGTGRDNLPYFYSRNGVKDDRKMIQYFLREETEELESDVQHAIEQELGTDVYLTDIREALVRVGAEHLDEVADELREWGYRYQEK